MSDKKAYVLMGDSIPNMAAAHNMLAGAVRDLLAVTRDYIGNPAHTPNDYDRRRALERLDKIETLVEACGIRVRETE